MPRNEQAFQTASDGIVTASAALVFLEKSCQEKAARGFLNLAFRKALALVTTFEESVSLFWIVWIHIENEPEMFSESFGKALGLATTEDDLDTITDKFSRLGNLVMNRKYIQQVFERADVLGCPTL